MKTGTHDRGTTFFPLYRYESLLGGKVEQIHNFTQEFINEWLSMTQTQFIPTGSGDGERTTGPEDILFWLYGLFHSLEYRRRYRASLSQRFPIVLLTSNLELFRRLARLGKELVALHLVEFVLADEASAPAEWPRYPRLCRFTGSDRAIEKFPAADKAWQDGRVAINASSGFAGVPAEVWQFHIGGYQVCHKWLKDRKGRTLTDADILHYCKIVTALNETIRLMRQIDEVIAEHGGWPGAFTAPAEMQQESQLPFA
jgi:predicted helicase